jgi:probable F420-dependent oxidoreductase
VLAHDFRRPAVLAKDMATLDVLSGGRVEVGVGAGWMQSEYNQAGIDFDAAGVRIARLEEYLIVLKGLFGDGPFSFSGEYFSIAALDGTPKPIQRPGPPILVGGGGDKLLAVAARQADIIQVMPRMRPPGQPVDPTQFSARAYRAKIDHIKAIAGERFPDIELGTQLMVAAVTDDVDAALDEFAAGLGISADGLGASPLVAVGSLDEVCDKLLAVRDEYGISYFACPYGANPLSLAPIIDKLAGA